MKRIDIEIGSLKITSKDGGSHNITIEYDGVKQYNIERLVLILDAGAERPKVFTKICTSVKT